MTTRRLAQRLIVTDLPDGTRRVELRCRCAKSGRVAERWDSLKLVILQLRADHQQRAPLCRHPEALPFPQEPRT